MPYILDTESEFQRLEKQASQPAWDYRQELAGHFPLSKSAKILDAGCGSGVVSRYLAELHRDGEIVGCDFAEHRLEQARQAARGLENLRFEKQALEQLTYGTSEFDAIVCRFVLKHLSPASRKQACQEFKRVLKPGGLLLAVDIDGLFGNIFPQPAAIADDLDRLEREGPVDLRMGRKMPAYLIEAGLEGVSWRIQTIECQGEILEQEIGMTRERVENASAFLDRFLGSEEKTRFFTEKYIEAMRRPETVLFYNKFIVTGKKAASGALKLVKS